LSAWIDHPVVYAVLAGLFLAGVLLRLLERREAAFVFVSLAGVVAYYAFLAAATIFVNRYASLGSIMIWVLLAVVSVNLRFSKMRNRSLRQAPDTSQAPPQLPLAA